MSIEADILGSIVDLRNNSLNHILQANSFENNENLDYEVTTIKHSICGSFRIFKIIKREARRMLYFKPEYTIFKCKI